MDKRKGDNTAGKRSGSTFGARLTLALWACSAAAFVALTWVTTQDVSRVLDGHEAEMPQLTQWTIMVGDFLRTQTGLLVAGGVFVATLLPFLFGGRGKKSMRFYGALAVLGFTATFLCLASVSRPMELLQKKLSEQSVPGK